MSKKISILTFDYTIFLVLLFLSGSLSGVFSELVYYLAFILPIGITLFVTRSERVERERYLTIDMTGVKGFLPLIFPTVSAIMLISYLTSILIFFISGKTNSVDLGSSFIFALITHALLPAILEEALFRYLPMRLLAPYSKRGAVLISAFFFSLVHHDLFSIPYAFLAGVIFMTVDLATDSIIPSVIIHFINNALSVGIIIFSDNPAFAPVIYIILAVLTLISLIAILKNREKYLKALESATEKGERVVLTIEMLLFAALTLTIAIINLL